MTEAQSKAIVTTLCAAYPQQAISEATFNVYTAALAAFPAEQATAAVYTVVHRSRFFPTVAEIVAEIVEAQLGIPDEAAALEQVEARCAWVRLPDDERTGEPSPLHPAVRRALDLVGGVHAFRAADEPAVVRGQFLRLFRAARDAEIADARAALPAGQTRPGIHAA